MGMYTELNLKVQLKDNISEEYLKVFRYMFDPKVGKELEFIPNHDLFKAENQRWEWMVQGRSAYFESKGSSFKYESDYKEMILSFNIKNYEYEIQKFINWIIPFCSNDLKEEVGALQYEEMNEPIIITLEQYVEKRWLKENW
jgi:hypothetical protein